MTLKQNVIDELDFDPRVDAAHVGVTVEDGIITLTGHVPSYAELIDAEHAVWRVSGVRGIAQEMTVDPPLHHETDDELLAHAIAARLEHNVRVPHEAIKVRVREGWVTLTGTLEWQFQRLEAASEIKRLSGVRGVVDQLRIESTPIRVDAAARIRQALVRYRDLDASGIDVKVDGATVVLDGRLDTNAHRDTVLAAAWSVPGVSEVIDRMTL